MNLDLNEDEVKILFKHFDGDGNGSIDFEEFIAGVRDSLSDHRLDLVEQVFDHLDIEGDGLIDADVIASSYNAARHPDVLAGKFTQEEVNKLPFILNYITCFIKSISSISSLFISSIYLFSLIYLI